MLNGIRHLYVKDAGLSPRLWYVRLGSATCSRLYEIQADGVMVLLFDVYKCSKNGRVPRANGRLAFDLTMVISIFTFNGKSR
jgi:hypothetical protein